MRVYHGSSTLPERKIPKAGPDNGVFVTPQEEFAKIFGRTIHCYELDESLILDLRKEKHRDKIKNSNFIHLLNLIEISEDSRLPQAFNHVVAIASLEATRDLALALGFLGAYFSETYNYVGIEIWDPNCLIWISTSDNPDFDSKNS